tara:strand:+ start:832 stop:1221 length:390 start_codon:yes stop_codon:yes gene_type:complete
MENNNGKKEERHGQGHGFGFMPNVTDSHPAEQYLGSEVRVCTNNGYTFYGNLSKVDLKEGVLYLQPSLTSDPDSKRVGIIEGKPTMVDMRGQLSITPLEKGWLEDFVERREAERTGRKIVTPLENPEFF